MRCLQVIEYLNKKGYHDTEKILRKEIHKAEARAQNKPVELRAEDKGIHRFFEAYSR